MAMRKIHGTSLAILVVLACSACGSEARLQVEEGTGPDPRLPPPDDEGFVPVVNIAPAIG